MCRPVTSPWFRNEIKPESNDGRRVSVLGSAMRCKQDQMMEGEDNQLLPLFVDSVVSASPVHTYNSVQCGLNDVFVDIVTL